MKKHVKETHDFQCQLCNTTFTSSVELELHSTELHNDVDQSKAIDTVRDSLYCAMCKIHFTASPLLEAHMKEEHTQVCGTCDKDFTTRSELKTHVKENHSFSCIYCEKVTTTQENMQEHVASEHRILCALCSCVLRTESELELHRSDKHPNACVICSTELVNKEDLDKHIDEHHTCTCDACGFIAINEDVMENHILDRHARPDEEGEYKCDDCDFKSSDKESFGKHFKQNHGSNSNRNESEGTKLQDNFRILKNNFDRLEMMYQDALEEADTVKADFEARLLKATDMYAAAKAEKEVLEEKVDVLFKLGRGYINAKKNLEKAAPDVDKNRDEVIVIDEVHRSIENNDDHEEDLVEWTKNKMRGFKRMNPASNPQSLSSKKVVPNSNNKNKPKENSEATPGSRAEAPPGPAGSSTPATSQTSPPPRPRPGDGSKDVSANKEVLENRKNYGTTQSVKYCHFFVNQGRCHFEERTGSKCKFLHEIAPMCNSGMNCSRFKCMYSHPKATPSRAFLGQKMMMNPWQIINPWLQDHPTPFFPQWRRQNHE